MSKARLEAFSDGVIAIIITIMVLDLRPPHEVPTLASLRPLLASLLTYTLSFIFLGIYWNNHHHLLQAAQRVNGRILWANLHLLFWLTLIPFATSWVSQGGREPWPVAAYGIVLLCCGAAFAILVSALVAHHGTDSVLARAIGTDTKGMVSLVIYLVAIPLAFWSPTLAGLLYISVAILWLVPDRRIERHLSGRADGGA